jgi:hypothetical protein
VVPRRRSEADAQTRTSAIYCGTDSRVPVPIYIAEPILNGMIRVKINGEIEFFANVSVISGHDLDSTLMDCWEDIWLANPDLSNPCFAPEFTKIASDFCENVEVAVLSTGAKIIAFFPFQRSKVDPTQGGPAADFIQDWGGLICRPGFSCDPMDLIHKCGLTSFRLHRFLGSQEFFEPFHSSREISAQIDLSKGYEAYVAEKLKGGSNIFRSCGNLAAESNEKLVRCDLLQIQKTNNLCDGFSPATALNMCAQDRRYFLYPLGSQKMETIHTTKTRHFVGTLSVYLFCMRGIK